MKKLYFIIIIIALCGCKKDGNGQLNPNAMISIWPGENSAEVQTKAWYHLSNVQIVKQTESLSFYNEAVFSTSITRGFSKNQRDSINIRLLMFGTDIIDQNGNYVGDFIEGRDFVFRRNLASATQTPIWDTIAYIPNSVIIAARTEIRAAYDRGDFATVYDTFDNAFSFTPITGIEWRALKATNQN